MEEVIYEKQYPHEDVLPEVRDYGRDNELPAEGKREAFALFYSKMLCATEYIYLPERKSGCQEFIQAAVAVSELYCLDVKVTRHMGMVCAGLSFDSGGDMKYLKKVLTLADDYSFFTGINNREITISLDYYTHAVYQNGKILAP